MAHHELYQYFGAATYGADNFLAAYKELDVCIFGSELEGEEAAVLLHRARVLHLLLDEAIAKIDKSEQANATIRALVEDVTAYQRGGGAPELSVRLPEQAQEAQDE